MYKYLDRKPLMRSQAQIQFNNIYTFGNSVAVHWSYLPIHHHFFSFTQTQSQPQIAIPEIELLYYGYFIIIIYNIIGGGITMGHGLWGREWNGIGALR